MYICMYKYNMTSSPYGCVHNFYTVARFNAIHVPVATLPLYMSIYVIGTPVDYAMRAFPTACVFFQLLHKAGVAFCGLQMYYQFWLL